jgi:hypothetical protein
MQLSEESWGDTDQGLTKTPPSLQLSLSALHVDPGRTPLPGAGPTHDSDGLTCHFRETTGSYETSHTARATARVNVQSRCFQPGATKSATWQAGRPRTVLFPRIMTSSKTGGAS